MPRTTTAVGHHSDTERQSKVVDRTTCAATASFDTSNHTRGRSSTATRIRCCTGIRPPLQCDARHSAKAEILIPDIGSVATRSTDDQSDRLQRQQTSRSFELETTSRHRTPLHLGR